MVLNAIKSAVGSVLMEQDSVYHIQYKHGVQIDLTNPIFDDEKKLLYILQEINQAKV